MHLVIYHLVFGRAPLAMHYLVMYLAVYHLVLYMDIYVQYLNYYLINICVHFTCAM